MGGKRPEGCMYLQYIPVRPAWEYQNSDICFRDSQYLLDTTASVRLSVVSYRIVRTVCRHTRCSLGSYSFGLGRPDVFGRLAAPRTGPFGDLGAGGAGCPYNLRCCTCIHLSKASRTRDSSVTHTNALTQSLTHMHSHLSFLSFRLSTDTALLDSFLAVGSGTLLDYLLSLSRLTRFSGTTTIHLSHDTTHPYHSLPYILLYILHKNSLPELAWCQSQAQADGPAQPAI